MRPLSAYESAIAYRSINEIYYNFIVAADFTVPLSVESIIKTLNILCSLHPQLSLHVDTSTVPPTASYLQPWTIDESIIDIVDSNVEDVLKKYTLYKFDYKDDKPLWKVLFNPESNTLFFVIEHVFFDGTAGKNFLSEFANHLLLKDASTSTTIDVVDTTKFKIHPDPTFLMDFKDRHQQVKNPDTLETFRGPLIESLMKSPLPNHNSTLLHISPMDTKKLLSYARMNDVKLTAILYSIASHTLVNILPTTNDKIFKTMIPINIRPQIRKELPTSSAVKFGLYFGKYFHLDLVSDLKSKTFIETAQYFQSCLNGNISHAMDDYEVTETNARSDPNIPNLSMQAMYKRNDKPLTSLVISNLGQLNSDVINQVYFDQPMVDSCFGIHLLSCSKGGIALNFTSHRAVDPQLYSKYVLNATSSIESIISH